MAELVFNPTSNEISISTANTVGNGQFVRLFNTNGSPAVVIFKDAGGNQYANLTMGASSSILIYKLALATVTGTGVVGNKVTSQSRTPQ